MIKYKYRILFYLDIDAKELLQNNQIEYTLKTTEKYKYCVVKKETNRLYQKINDDNLLSKLLGPEYQEFLAYTYRVH
tara:strand:- start:480 stop:710 length:231 start_codon:yes stop_codon:yes gene_type:complete